MTALPFPNKWACLGLLAGLVLGAWPAAAGAAGIGFHNQMKTSVYIEAASLVRGRVIVDAPLLISPGKVRFHMNVPPGKRVIRIYEANRPARLLFQGQLSVVDQNLFFAIQPDATRATLVPAKPPKP